MYRLSVLSFVLLSLVSPAASERPTVEHIIERDINVALPLTPCSVPRYVTRIVQATGEPAGIERLPEQCTAPRKLDDVKEWLPLAGLHVRDALDKLTALDSRYRWAESDGVIVLRPAIAWADPNHFLHSTFPSFHVHDQRLGGAMVDLDKAFGSPRSLDQDLRSWALDDRRFSVNENAISIIETLNAIVRAHGSATWEIDYCQPPARFETAMLYMLSLDNSTGVGRAMATLTDRQGRWYSACLPRDSRSAK
jgi:hypothetical protein